MHNKTQTDPPFVEEESFTTGGAAPEKRLSNMDVIMKKISNLQEAVDKKPSTEDVKELSNLQEAAKFLEADAKLREEEEAVKKSSAELTKAEEAAEAKKREVEEVIQAAERETLLLMVSCFLCIPL
jgi:hypothetical protein